MKHASLLAGGIALLLLPRFVLPTAAGAAIPGLAWDPVEIVDHPVEWLPPVSGNTLAFDGARWHIVYTIGGFLAHRMQGESGWLPADFPWGPFTVSDGPAIAAGGGLVHVVWQAAYEWEVYAQRWDGSQWTTPECLSCDGWPSHGPVVAVSGSRALAAWEENGAEHTVIRGRLFENGAWGPVEDLSSSPSEARRPSVSESGDDGGFFLAWVDHRDGDREIYVRYWTPWSAIPWQPEQRLTDLEQEVDWPSIHGENCCGDVLSPLAAVAFEYGTPPGSPVAYWAWNGYPGGPLSPPGQYSYLPVMTGYHLLLNSGDLYAGPYPHLLVTWTDGNWPRNNLLECFGCPAFNYVVTRDTLSTHGYAGSTVAAVEGPATRIMAAWIEERDGEPTLLTRSGTLPGENLGAPAPPRSAAIALVVVPNPVRGSAELRLHLPTAQPTAVRILDVVGRQVRDLGLHDLAAGRATIRWDGRDEAGRAVSPGLYFAVVRQPGGEARRSFVLLR